MYIEREKIILPIKKMIFKPKNFYGKNKLIIEKYLNKKFNKKII